MERLRSYAMALCWLLSAVSGVGQPDRSPEVVRIVALGDSITRGARPAKGAFPAVSESETFCADLARRFADAGWKVEMTNAGVPGNRTDQGITRLQADVLNHQPDFVLIMYGTNDSCYDAGKAEPRLPLDEYRKNLSALIAGIREAGATPILMTPPPLRKGWGAGRNAIYVKQGANGPLLPYVEACREIAASQKVPLIDHFAAWSGKGDAFVAPLLPDGCHPNAEGHKVLADAIFPILIQQRKP